MRLWTYSTVSACLVVVGGKGCKGGTPALSFHLIPGEVLTFRYSGSGTCNSLFFSDKKSAADKRSNGDVLGFERQLRFLVVKAKSTAAGRLYAQADDTLLLPKKKRIKVVEIS